MASKVTIFGVVKTTRYSEFIWTGYLVFPYDTDKKKRRTSAYYIKGLPPEKIRIQKAVGDGWMVVLSNEKIIHTEHLKTDAQRWVENYITNLNGDTDAC